MINLLAAPIALTGAADQFEWQCWSVRWANSGQLVGVLHEIGGSHAWGRIYCPYNDEECRCGEFCITSVWSTPKNPGNHARALRRVVDNCTTHRKQREAEGDAKE